MKDTERCTFLDGAGCRCLLPLNHRGLHDPSLTPWVQVEKVRAERRLAAIRDGALKGRAP